MTAAGPEMVQKGLKQVRMAAGFKYYIHDTGRGFLLELFGQFADPAVRELASCWDTAKCTLKDRILTLDLRNVTLIDEAARRWLSTMAQDGAKFLPESFLRDAMAGLNREQIQVAETPKPGFFVRLFRFSS